MTGAPACCFEAPARPAGRPPCAPRSCGQSLGCPGLGRCFCALPGSAGDVPALGQLPRPPAPPPPREQPPRLPQPGSGRGRQAAPFTDTVTLRAARGRGGVSGSSSAVSARGTLSPSRASSPRPLWPRDALLPAPLPCPAARDGACPAAPRGVGLCLGPGAWGVIWQRPAGGRERTREDGDGPVGRDAGGTYSDTDERRTSVRVSRGRRRSAGP